MDAALWEELAENLAQLIDRFEECAVQDQAYVMLTAVAQNGFGKGHGVSANTTVPGAGGLSPLQIDNDPHR
jgi:hypothetical protein